MMIEHKDRNFKYYIDEVSYVFLQEWAERNKPLVEGLIFANSFFSKKCIVYLQTDNRFNDYCFFTVKNNYIKGEFIVCLKGTNLKESNKFKMFPINEKNKLQNTDGSPCDIEVSSEYNKATTDMIRLLCSAYIHINAFMFYGNITDDNQLKAISRNDHIYLKPYQDKLYAIPLNSTSIHRSPQGIFSVRGHFRKYKSGKVIWIDEYLKGLKKDK